MPPLQINPHSRLGKWIGWAATIFAVLAVLAAIALILVSWQITSNFCGMDGCGD